MKWSCGEVVGFLFLTAVLVMCVVVVVLHAIVAR